MLGALDVKWDQLICQKLQLHARKIRILVAAVRRTRRPSRYCTLVLAHIWKVPMRPMNVLKSGYSGSKKQLHARSVVA
jgi:hypothetical protein